MMAYNPHPEGVVRLASLQVLEPCQERWEEMSGDERSRRCARCEHSVTDLSTLEEKEAEQALAAGPLCVRFVRGVDGKIITRTTQYQRLVEVLRSFATKRKG